MRPAEMTRDLAPQHGRSRAKRGMFVCVDLCGEERWRRKQSRTSYWRESGRGRCEEKGQIVCELLTVRVR